MKFTGPFLCVAVALLHFASAKEDRLFSKQHMRKRFIDESGNYNISFYHINDVHAHLDEFRSSGTDCTDPSVGCYGGYARVKTVVDKTRPGHKDSLFLNVGDEFQGTLFYTYYGGEKIAQTINQLGFDGMTLGNHEFDGGDDKLGEFLQNLTFPIISANIVSDHPVLNATIKPFHIYEEFGLAVIGVTTETTTSISKPGEGTTFTDVVEAVQRTVDFIRGSTNVTRIAAITHIGYDEDQRLAESTTGLQLIMDGHSHTPLGNFTGAVGPYPTIKTNLDGDEVFIVTAYRRGEYLGYIDVTYDPNDKILSYHGAPIHLTNTTTQDPDLQAQIEEWRVPFEEFSAEVIGESFGLLGDFMADAMLSYRLNQSNTASCAIINAGGIRSTIDIGPITRGEVLTSFPFGNSIVEISLIGQEVWDAIEGSVSKVSSVNGAAVTSSIQVSRQLRVVYDPSGLVGSRLVSVDIGVGLEPIDLVGSYNVVTLDFLAGGGDNIFQKTSDFAVLDTQDEVLTAYIQQMTPVDIALDGRISVVNETAVTRRSRRRTVRLN